MIDLIGRRNEANRLVQQRAGLDRRAGDRRRAQLDDASAELRVVYDRRRAARRADRERRLESARFNHALAAWHAGPEYFARWQADRRKERTDA